MIKQGLGWPTNTRCPSRRPVRRLPTCLPVRSLLRHLLWRKLTLAKKTVGEQGAGNASRLTACTDVHCEIEDRVIVVAIDSSWRQFITKLM